MSDRHSQLLVRFPCRFPSNSQPPRRSAISLDWLPSVPCNLHRTKQNSREFGSARGAIVALRAARRTARPRPASLSRSVHVATTNSRSVTTSRNGGSFVQTESSVTSPRYDPVRVCVCPFGSRICGAVKPWGCIFGLCFAEIRVTLPLPQRAAASGQDDKDAFDEETTITGDPVLNEELTRRGCVHKNGSSFVLGTPQPTLCRFVLTACAVVRHLRLA
jgi:hypothetical protein